MATPARGAPTLPQLRGEQKERSHQVWSSNISGRWTACQHGRLGKCWGSGGKTHAQAAQRGRGSRWGRGTEQGCGLHCGREDGRLDALVAARDDTALSRHTDSRFSPWLQSTVWAVCVLHCSYRLVITVLYVLGNRRICLLLLLRKAITGGLHVCYWFG